MKVVDKFVINRNNMRHIYTESIITYNEHQYITYDNNQVTAYTPDSFYATYGTDSKLSITKFINLAESNLAVAAVYDERTKYAMDLLKKVKDKIAGKGIKNPPLRGNKEDLINAIGIFNLIINENDLFDEHDYEADYERIQKLLGKDGYARVRQDI